MRIENNHYPETPRYLYLMMNLLEKVMMTKSQDYQLTIKTPSDYEDTVKSDADKKSDDHPITIKSPSPSESLTTRRGRATGESFLCGLLASCVYWVGPKIFFLGKSGRLRATQNGTYNAQLKILRPLLQFKHLCHKRHQLMPI